MTERENPLKAVVDSRIPEIAPRRLVYAGRSIIRNAMKLVRFGEIDEYGVRKFLAEDSRSGQVYSIVDTHAGEKPDKQYPLGLFIDPVELNKNTGEIERQHNGLAFPRHPKALTEKSLQDLRFLQPRSLWRVARQLHRALKVEEKKGNKWVLAYTIFNGKDREDPTGISQQVQELKAKSTLRAKREGKKKWSQRRRRGSYSGYGKEPYPHTPRIVQRKDL